MNTHTTPRHARLLAEAAASRSPGRLRPADHVFRAAAADAFRLTQPGLDAERAHAALFGDDALGLAVLRTAVSPLNTSTAGAVLELMRTALADFIGGLTPISAAAALFSRAVALSLERRGSVFVPSITSGLTAHWVEENEPIPVASASFAAEAQVSGRKLGALVGLSREAAKRSNIEAVVRMLLSEAAAARLDATLFDDEAADAERPAGLLNGVAPIVGHPGGDVVALQADVTALIAAVAGVGSAVLVMHPARMIALQILAPGVTLPVLATGHIDPGTVIAIVPRALAVASGGFEVDSSIEAVIHMSDVPLEIVSDTGPTVAAPTRSAFQSDSIVLRMLLDIDWTLRAAGVAWIEGSSW